MPGSVTDRLNSLLGSQADFADHNGCPPEAPSCAFSIGSANAGTGATGVVGTAFGTASTALVGLGGGYGVEHSDLYDGGKADLGFSTGAAFLAHAPDAGLQFTAAASAMWITADIDRGYMNGGGTTTSSGSTTGAGYGGLARIGWAFRPAPAFAFIPFAEYDFIRESLAAYTETSGPFPAMIGEMANTEQTTRLGTEARYAGPGGSSLWSSLAWAHRFGDAAPAISASLIDLFDVASPADASGADWLEAAAGIKLPLTARAAIDSSVTLAAFSSNVPSVQGDVGLSAAF